MADYKSGTCWNCGIPLGPLAYGRADACPGCGKQTHVCRNCRFYAPGRPNECQEPAVERVIDKDRANFCDWFEPSAQPASGKAGAAPDDLLKSAEDLFK